MRGNKHIRVIGYGIKVNECIDDLKSIRKSNKEKYFGVYTKDEENYIANNTFNLIKKHTRNLIKSIKNGDIVIIIVDINDLINDYYLNCIYNVCKMTIENECLSIIVVLSSECEKIGQYKEQLNELSKSVNMLVSVPVEHNLKAINECYINKQELAFRKSYYIYSIYNLIDSFYCDGKLEDNIYDLMYMFKSSGVSYKFTVVASGEDEIEQAVQKFNKSISSYLLKDKFKKLILMITCNKEYNSCLKYIVSKEKLLFNGQRVFLQKMFKDENLNNSSIILDMIITN